MNFIFVVATVGFVACAYAAPSDGQKKHHYPPQCLGKNLTLTEEMKTAEKTCLAKHPEEKTTDEKKTKDLDHKHPNMTCFMQCKYEAIGLITDNKFNTDKIGAFVKQVFPESVTATLTKAFTTCADANGANLAVKDGNCDSYEPLFKCMFTAAKENCKTEDAKV